MLQTIADGLLNGAIIALGAIGLTLTMGILRFANFAHAELITWGAYVALAVVAALPPLGGALAPLSFGLPLLIGLVVAMVASSALALAADAAVFRPLRARRSDPMTLVFASFGMALLVRMAVLLLFGGSARYYSTELTFAVEVLPGLLLLPDQLFTFALTAALWLALLLFLQRTTLGLSMRALAENPDLTRVNGIDVAVVTRWTWIIGGSMAAIAGVLYGLSVQLRPEIGFHLILPLFTAAILGGLGNVTGALAGGMIVGLAESLAVLVIPPEYKPAVPFLILLAVLFVRPGGLFGAIGGAR